MRLITLLAYQHFSLPQGKSCTVSETPHTFARARDYMAAEVQEVSHFLYLHSWMEIPLLRPNSTDVSEVYFASGFSVVSLNQLASRVLLASRLLLDLFFHLEDGSDIILRNVV
jgi:hypothetical protein